MTVNRANVTYINVLSKVEVVWYVWQQGRGKDAGCTRQNIYVRKVFASQEQKTTNGEDIPNWFTWAVRILKLSVVISRLICCVALKACNSDDDVRTPLGHPPLTTQSQLGITEISWEHLYHKPRPISLKFHAICWVLLPIHFGDALRSIFKQHFRLSMACYGNSQVTDTQTKRWRVGSHSSLV
jgi:hypothetical protein